MRSSKSRAWFVVRSFQPTKNVLKNIVLSNVRLSVTRIKKRLFVKFVENLQWLSNLAIADFVIVFVQEKLNH